MPNKFVNSNFWISRRINSKKLKLQKNDKEQLVNSNFWISRYIYPRKPKLQTNDK